MSARSGKGVGGEKGAGVEKGVGSHYDAFPSLGQQSMTPDPFFDPTPFSTPGKMQKEVERGQAPRQVDSAHKGRGPYENGVGKGVGSH